MDPIVEEILMARAMRDSQGVPDVNSAVTAGGIVGALGGAAVGSLPHAVLRNTLGRFPGRNHPMKPGARMAGGLMGAILGGGLGAGTRQMMIQDSPAANMLALMQAQGTLNPMDRSQLQSVLKDIYNNPGM